MPVLLVFFWHDVGFAHAWKRVLAVKLPYVFSLAAVACCHLAAIVKAVWLFYQFRYDGM